MSLFELYLQFYSIVDFSSTFREGNQFALHTLDRSNFGYFSPQEIHKVPLSGGGGGGVNYMLGFYYARVLL